MIAALDADVVKAPAPGHLDLHHLGQARRPGAAFQHGQFGPGLDLDAVMQDRVGRRCPPDIDQRHRPRGAPRRPDQHAIGGMGGT